MKFRIPSKSKFMRIFNVLFLLLLLSTSIYAQPADSLIQNIPNPRKTTNSWIYQEVDVLQDRYADINNSIDSLERATSAEIAVVILASIGDNVVEDFAAILFNRWGIGKKEKNNGVLVLHVLDQRKIRIETGYDVEGVLPDLACKRIIDDITIPYFKQNNFPDGHYWTVKAIESFIVGNPVVDFASFGKSPLKARSIDVDSEVEQKKMALANRYEDEFTKNFYQVATFGLLLLVLLIVFINGFLFVRGQKQNDPFKQYFFVQKRNSYMSRIIGAPLVAWGVYAFFTSDGMIIPALSLIFGFISWNIFPWDMLLKKKNLGALRIQPRICDKCSGKMHKLKENQEDEYLTQIMQAEEKVGLVEYDVWACSCGNTRVDNYKSGLRARNCPKCKNPTYALVGSQTLEQATASTSGREKEFYECGFCAYKNTIIVTIPSYGTSDSSSSDWSSSSSSDFGGGSSGGGGASGSY